MQIPDWVDGLLDRDDIDLILTPHGRAAGTSQAYARATLMRCADRQTNVVILRQYKSSADDSLLALMRTIARDEGIPHQGAPTSKTINMRAVGSRITVAGTERNINALKGLLDHADITILEECDGSALKAADWRVIEPTLRRPGAKAIMNWNPGTEDEIAWQLYKNPPPRTWKQFLTYENNPWLPERVQRSIDNAHANDDQHMIAVYAGKFPPGGGIFRVSELSYGPIPDGAEIAAQVRAWDLAATEGDGDYTCGGLVTVADGRLYVSDVRYGQWAPHRVLDEVERAAVDDGPMVPVHIEEQPGAAGKMVQGDFNARIVRGVGSRLLWVASDAGERGRQQRPGDAGPSGQLGHRPADGVRRRQELRLPRRRSGHAGAGV